MTDDPINGIDNPSFMAVPRFPVRPVTVNLLMEFEDWTRSAPMFLSSPQGTAFAEELREVIRLAARALTDN